MSEIVDSFVEGVKEGIGKETLERTDKLLERADNVTPEISEGFTSTITDPAMWIVMFVIAIGSYVIYRYLRYGRKTI